MKYPMNEKLLSQACEVIYNRKNIYWAIGGACSGKSTVCKALCDRYDVLLYDMDEYIFDKYQNRYTEELYPANRAWFTAKNPLEWALSFPSWEENNEFNIAAAAEYLSLFCEDMKALDPNRTVLVDGGITNPAVLTKVLPPQQVFCIRIEDDLCDSVWAESSDRESMREMIFRLPAPQDKWSKFLLTNRLMNHQIQTECRENGIKIFFRNEETTLEELLNEVSELIVHKTLRRSL